MNPRDRLVVYRDTAAEWRWKLVARNGRIIASSGESFDSRSNATRAAYRANPETSAHGPADETPEPEQSP